MIKALSIQRVFQCLKTSTAPYIFNVISETWAWLEAHWSTPFSFWVQDAGKLMTQWCGRVQQLDCNWMCCFPQILWLMCPVGTAVSTLHFIQTHYFQTLLNFTLNRKMLQIHLTGLNNYTLKHNITVINILSPNHFSYHVQNLCGIE